MGLQQLRFVTGAIGCILLLALRSADAEEQVISASAKAESASPWRASAEKHDVDALDLYAIALQESRRRRDDGMLRPWPWTLHTPEAGSLYFETYEAALEKLRSLIAQGTKNIDVGLMQINWGWNGHRATAERLLLPADNIEIAAQILREHLNEYGGNRRLAVARYHSPRPERGIPYAASVLAIADELRQSTAIQLALSE